MSDVTLFLLARKGVQLVVLSNLHRREVNSILVCTGDKSNDWRCYVVFGSAR